MYGPTPKISISTSTPGPEPPSGSTTWASIEAPSGIAIVVMRETYPPAGTRTTARAARAPRRAPDRRTPDVNRLHASCALGETREARIHHWRRRANGSADGHGGPWRHHRGVRPRERTDGNSRRP